VRVLLPCNDMCVCVGGGGMGGVRVLLPCNDSLRHVSLVSWACEGREGREGMGEGERWGVKGSRMEGGWRLLLPGGCEMLLCIQTVSTLNFQDCHKCSGEWTLACQAHAC
jgi:hypothetical protein